MNNILTLCAEHNSGQNGLDDNLLSRLVNKGLDYSKVIKRNSFVIDLECTNKSITKGLREVLYENKIDFALQPKDKKAKKLLFSDMDSTILTNETTDELAYTLGIEDEIKKITNLAMQGEIDFENSFRQRLFLLKGISKATVEKQISNINYSAKADYLLAEISKRNIYSVLISGGFSIYADVVRENLGFSESVANQLSFDNKNKLDGKYIGELVDEKFKLSYLKKLAKEKSISLSETVAIGDGANDIPMLKNAGLGIAFYGKQITRDSVNAEIHSGPISNILWFL